MNIDERHHILQTHVRFWYAVRTGTVPALLLPQADQVICFLIKPKLDTTISGQKQP